MKILLTADWHIKIGAKNIPNEWAYNRYRLMFSQIHSMENLVDIHIIAGDIVDKIPNMEELSLYFEFVKECTIETLIIPGNHEAIKKDTTFLTHLKNATASINSLVRIIDDFETYKGIDFIPYNKLKEFEKGTSFPFTYNLLVSHFRAEIPPHVKPEIDLALFDRWHTVLAGDLHSYDNCQRNILYPGSPVTTSFHRNPVDTGVIIFDTESMTHEWKKLQVPQLIKTSISVGEELVPGDYDLITYEVFGDMAELGAMADSELIDKKVVKRDIDTALILDPKMTLAEELREYLLYISQLPDPKVEHLVHVLHDNMSKLTE